MATIDGVTVVMPPPDGYVVDFDNPQRTGTPDVYFIAGFGGALSLIFFFQRLYVKMFLAGGLQLDDYLLILSVIFVFTTSGFTLHMFSNAIGGVHAWEISLEDFNRYMLDVYIAAVTYVLCGSFAKLSLLVFYLRISPEKWFRIASWTTIFIISGYTIGIAVALIFACQPIARMWDVTITEGFCLNLPSLYIAIAVSNIASDVVLFFLPLPMVIKLHIPLRQKIGLFFIFGIGSMTVITSIVRVSILPELLTNPDGPWTVGNASVWTQVEGYLIIMCASLPTLRMFFRHFAPKLLGESYGSKSKTKDNSQPISRTLAAASASQSRRDRTLYSQFDPEEGITTETYVMGPVKSKHGRRNRPSTDDAGASGDDGSEKGIVTGTNNKEIVATTVFTIDVEHRAPGSEQDSKR